MSTSAAERKSRELTDVIEWITGVASNHPYILGFLGFELILSIIGIALDVAAGPAAAVYTHRTVANVTAGVLSAFVVLVGIAGLVIALSYNILLHFTEL